MEEIEDKTTHDKGAISLTGGGRPAGTVNRTNLTKVGRDTKTSARDPRSMRNSSGGTYGKRPEKPRRPRDKQSSDKTSSNFGAQPKSSRVMKWNIDGFNDREKQKSVISCTWEQSVYLAVLTESHLRDLEVAEEGGRRDEPASQTHTRTI